MFYFLPGRPRVWRSAAAAAACCCPGQWCCGVGVKVVRWPEEQQQQHQHQHSTALSTCPILWQSSHSFTCRGRFWLSCFCMVQKEIVFKLFGKMQSFGNETINQTHDSHLTGCQDWCSEKLSLEYAVNLAHTLLVPPQSSFRADIISLCTRCWSWPRHFKILT